MEKQKNNEIDRETEGGRERERDRVGEIYMKEEMKRRNREVEIEG